MNTNTDPPLVGEDATALILHTLRAEIADQAAVIQTYLRRITELEDALKTAGTDLLSASQERQRHLEEIRQEVASMKSITRKIVLQRDTVYTLLKGLIDLLLGPKGDTARTYYGGEIWRQIDAAQEILTLVELHRK
jgi:hypothetical protein